MVGGYTGSNKEYIVKKTVAYRADGVIHATYTSPGEIDVSSYKTLTLFIEYTKGTEAGIDMKVNTLHTTSGTEFQYGTWSVAAGVWTPEAGAYSFTASTDAVHLTIDVTGVNYVKIYEKSKDANVDGTLALTTVLSNAK